MRKNIRENENAEQYSQIRAFVRMFNKNPQIQNGDVTYEASINGRVVYNKKMNEYHLNIFIHSDKTMASTKMRGVRDKINQICEYVNLSPEQLMYVVHFSNESDVFDVHESIPHHRDRAVHKTHKKINTSKSKLDAAQSKDWENLKSKEDEYFPYEEFEFDHDDLNQHMDTTEQTCASSSGAVAIPMGMPLGRGKKPVKEHVFFHGGNTNGFYRDDKNELPTGEDVKWGGAQQLQHMNHAIYKRFLNNIREKCPELYPDVRNLVAKHSNLKSPSDVKWYQLIADIVTLLEKNGISVTNDWHVVPPEEFRMNEQEQEMEEAADSSSSSSLLRTKIRKTLQEEIMRISR